MQVIASARQSGKTTKMIKWLREKPSERLLITFSRKEAERLQGIYQDVATRITDWYSYCERRLEAWHPHPKEVGIDNADIVLQGLVRDELTKISITKGSI